MTDNLKLRPALNLQLFGEGEEPVESVEPEPQPAQGEVEEPTYASLSEFLNQYEQETGEAEQTQEVEPQTQGETQEAPPEEKSDEEKLILGKFKTQEDLVDAYQEAEKRISRYGQYSSRAKKELEQLRGQVAQLQRYVKEAQQPKKEQPSKEEIERRNQEWLDKFYDNPVEALDEVVQDRVKKVVEPIQKDYEMQRYTRHYNSQVQEVRQKYPDFDNYTPKMQEIVQKQGQYLANLPNAVEVVYNMAKAQSMPSQPTQQLSKENLLKDENFRQDILKDQSIRNEILKEYAQQARDKQAPVVLGKQSGEPPASPPEEIKSTKDAKKASMNFFQRIAGGGTQ